MSAGVFPARIATFLQNKIQLKLHSRLHMGLKFGPYITSIAPEPKLTMSLRNVIESFCGFFVLFFLY